MASRVESRRRGKEVERELVVSSGEGVNKMRQEGKNTEMLDQQAFKKEKEREGYEPD